MCSGGSDNINLAPESTSSLTESKSLTEVFPLWNNNNNNNNKHNIFKQNTNLGYVYIPYNSTSLYSEDKKQQNVITLNEKLDIYDNPVISINNTVKIYFGYENDINISTAPTITQYIKWLHTIYVINKDVYLSPF